ncbi:MAG: polysaccharide deacetylase family protein [Bacteroidales bacterium]|jgi:hypothetical protein|nr:polysaccharide deacetylase family protein [Bacteroidales bacterium]
MIKISIPDFLFIEKQYVVSILFNTFLGVNVDIVRSNSKNYSIWINAKYGKIVIKDSFLFTKTEDYLTLKNIPSRLIHLKINDYSKSIIGFWGDSTFVENEEKIYIGLDIFASAFFMLSRWEEHVVKTRDEYNRFEASDSVAYKLGFLDRPIVNEYVEFLWKLLLKIGYNGKRKEHKYTVIPTHDIDYIDFQEKSFKRFAKDIVQQRSFKLFFSRIKALFINPFNVYEYLMYISEMHQCTSRFYFMAGGNTKYDFDSYLKSPKFKRIVNEIRDRGHIIGIHPSYNTYDNESLLKDEKQMLEEASGEMVYEGRQHYLRFKNPDTWIIWNNAGLKIDSTLSYATIPGFRCGVCYDFPVFDIIERKTLDLLERPLIFMDASLVKYQNTDDTNFLEQIVHLKDTVKKYNGNFVFLWHNSSFNWGNWRKYQKYYKRLFE